MFTVDSRSLDVFLLSNNSLLSLLFAAVHVNSLLLRSWTVFAVSLLIHFTEGSRTVEQSANSCDCNSPRLAFTWLGISPFILIQFMPSSAINERILLNNTRWSHSNLNAKRTLGCTSINGWICTEHTFECRWCWLCCRHRANSAAEHSPSSRSHRV